MSEMKNCKTAFITGITGQDGSYLAEFLLRKGYEVHGLIRRASVFNTARVEHLRENKKFFLYHGDLTDSSNIHSLLSKIKPDEVYNLAAQSHVAVSFDIPEYTADVDGVGVIRLLNAIKDLQLDTKFYQASTSELFGGLQDTVPQSEKTPFHPRSPYAAAKIYAYWVTVNYREAYGMFASNGILFNHESPRRGETFVTKKISKAVANIYHGNTGALSIGNLDAKRDWGYAKDYVEMMWLMLQSSSPSDYVAATGKAYTVRQFIELAFERINIEIDWDGSGEKEIGIDKKTGRILVKVNPKYYRPTEVDHLLGDPSKAFNDLGWVAKTSLPELVKIMVDYDLKFLDYGHDFDGL